VRNTFINIAAIITTLLIGVGLQSLFTETPRTTSIIIKKSNVFRPFQNAEPEAVIKSGDTNKVQVLEKTDPAKIECSNKTILNFLPQILKDPEFLDRNVTYKGPVNCEELFEIKQVDLNRDGRKEILVRGTTIPLCGGVGNCSFWIFEKKRKNYRALISGSDYVDQSTMGSQVLPTSTKGYRDILLKGHFSSSETGYYYMKFNGRKYIDAKCLYNVFDKEVNGKAKFKFITCDEFEKELELDER